MRHKRLLTATLLITCFLTMGFACNKNKAMQTSAGVAASLKAMQDTEISLHKIGKVDDAEHRLLQQGFIVLAKSDKDVRQCIYLSGAQSCVDIGINAVNNLLASPAVIGIKNADSKQQMQLLGGSVVTALTVLKGAL